MSIISDVVGGKQVEQKAEKAKKQTKPVEQAKPVKGSKQTKPVKQATPRHTVSVVREDADALAELGGLLGASRTNGGNRSAALRFLVRVVLPDVKRKLENGDPEAEEWKTALRYIWAK